MTLQSFPEFPAFSRLEEIALVKMSATVFVLYLITWKYYWGFYTLPNDYL